MSPVYLTEGNVRLIPYGPEHDQRTVAWLNDGDLRKTFGLSHAITLESHRRWLDNAPDVLVWAIADDSLEHQGNTLLHCARQHRSAYFQIYIGNSKARGRGFGSLAMTAVLRHAFEELGLHRIWLHTLEGNVPAERMYETAGFVREGSEREAILRDGAFHTQFRWSLLADEWHARKGSGAK